MASRPSQTETANDANPVRQDIDIDDPDLLTGGTSTPNAATTSLRQTMGVKQSHLPTDLGILSLSAMAEPKNRAGEYLRGISMPGIISAVTETYGGNPETTTRIDPLWDGIAKDIRRSDGSGSGNLPRRLDIPRAEASRYVETYYAVVDFRYPRLPREDVMKGVEAITAADESEYVNLLATSPTKIFMAYMVIAITPLVSDRYPVAQASFVSIHILSKALKILDRVFLQEDGVDIIHSLLLLVIFSFHSSAAGSTWHLVGVAMKKCIALGFHREVGGKGTRKGSEKEPDLRRWAFWSCYILVGIYVYLYLCLCYSLQG
jgi:hypothetical protein